MDTNDIRKGLKLMFNDQPHVVLDFQFVKSGKGQPIVRTSLRNMLTGAVVQPTYKSGDKIEQADIEERQLEYVRPEGAEFVFMDAINGENLSVQGSKIGDGARWLSNGMPVDVTFFRGEAVGVTLPKHVVLQIVTSESSIKGDSSSRATKAATLSTGAVVNVPLFVQEGEWVKIDTIEGKYIDRVNPP